MDKKEKEIVWYRESAIQAIIADVITFGFIFGGLLLNKYLLMGRWYIDIFFIWMLLFMVLNRSNKKAKIFTNKKALRKYLNEKDNG